MEIVEFLISNAAREALEQLSTRDFDPVRDVPWLRKRFPAEQAAAIAGMAAGRRLAQAKFGAFADQMLYDLESIQQATPFPVALHRAARFGDVDPIIDLGCGIGGDAMALSGTVVGVDIDAKRLAMARHNVGRAGGRLVGVRADIGNLVPFDGPAAFADPARRDGQGRRIFDPSRYRPPLGLLVDRWARHLHATAIKVHPGIRHSDVPDDAEAEFVSLDGDMREACLWFGSLRSGARSRATMLPAGISISGAPLAVTPAVSDVGSWLFEPDPAVIRAGLVGDVATRFGIAAVDQTIAYLTGPEPIDSPLVTAHSVEDVMPFNAKRIKGYLRERGVGSIVVKKRGTAVDPDRFRRGLDLSGDARKMVILTRARGKPIAIICAA